MQVKIKRIDKTLPLPKYETQGSVAFDFIARENTVIEPHGIGRVPSNIILEIPKGYMVLVKDRSSTAKKKGILMTAGIIDQDFCGDNDEILMQFYNPSDAPIIVERGEKLAQGIFVAVGIGEWQEVDAMNKQDRGGFGTTDSANYANEMRIDANKSEKKISINLSDSHNFQKGKLIAIDGIDGSGKATQTRVLVNRLLEQGYGVVTADFPQYGTKSAGLVEEYLNGKYGASKDVNPYIASFFYALDRYDASFKIRSWLNEGKIVITDRYVSANMGHQGGKFDTADKRQEYFKWLDYYEYSVFSIPRPDMTLILHIPYEYSRNLMKTRDNKKYIENETNLDIHESDKDHLKRAEQTYLEMCELFDDFELIECAPMGHLLSIEEISDLVREKVSKIL